jgi:hypothetical protein
MVNLLTVVDADKLLTGWDDDCSGLVATIAREVVWQERQDHNDMEAAQWAVEAPDGWGGNAVAKPIEEGWPGVQPEDRWLDLPLPPSGGVLVTMTTIVEKEEGHSACRLLIL